MSAMTDDRTSRSRSSAADADGGDGPMDLERLTALFKLLADPTRLSLLAILARGERHVTSLCVELKLPQPTVSHHLGLLRESGLIVNRRNGKQIIYSLSADRMARRAAGLTVEQEPFTVAITRKAGSNGGESAARGKGKDHKDVPAHLAKRGGGNGASAAAR